MKWFRLYTEIKRDPKLRRLPATYRWAWITILCMARESPRPGWLLLRKNMPAQPADIADEANVPLEDAARAIELFKSGSYEMLAEEDGVLRVVNWGKRQFENDSSAARTRLYRERLNGRKTDPNAKPRHGASSCDGAGDVPCNVTRDGRCDVTRDVTGDGDSDVTGDVSKSSHSSSHHSPRKNCGEGPRNDGQGRRDSPLSTRPEKPLAHAASETRSSEARHGDSHCDVTSDVTGDGGCDVAGNVTGDVTLQSYRDTEKNIEIREVSESIFSASRMGDEPGTVPEPPTFSAPDGAAPANPFIVDEMTVEGDAAKLPDEVGANLSRRSRSVQENLADRNMSRRSSDSTGSPASDSCLDTLETGSPDLSDDKPQRQEIEKGATRQISPDDVRATTPEPPATVSLASASGGTATAATPKVYISKRKRKLSGWKLESFEEFWDAFALKKGRADAADAWLDIPGLTAELAAIIIKAARKEAAARPSLAATNQSPKWAQGWLSSRRWEDWEEDSGTARNQGNQDNASGREVKDDAKASPSRRDEESPYHKSIDEAFRRFL